MAFLFGGKQKKLGIPELAAQMRSQLDTLATVSASKALAKARSEMSRLLAETRKLVLPDDTAGAGDDTGPRDEVSPDDAAHELAEAVLEDDLLANMLEHLTLLEFEARKDAVALFERLLREQADGGTRFPIVEALCARDEMLSVIMLGYGNTDIALNCGAMIRAALAHESVARWLLFADELHLLFDLMEDTAFDVATDAFLTFRKLLTSHANVLTEFMETRYEAFFDSYARLLECDNYATRRQSLSLLGDLLLDRANISTMKKYIASSANLKAVMRLLRDKSRNIQFEAFHVFKIFVANPTKPPAVLHILQRNANRLVNFLADFQKDRRDDTQFVEEKAYLINIIQSIRDAAGPTSGSAGPPPTSGAAAPSHAAPPSTSAAAPAPAPAPASAPAPRSPLDDASDGSLAYNSSTVVSLADVVGRQF